MFVSLGCHVFIRKYFLTSSQYWAEPGMGWWVETWSKNCWSHPVPDELIFSRPKFLQSSSDSLSPKPQGLFLFCGLTETLQIVFSEAHPPSSTADKEFLKYGSRICWRKGSGEYFQRGVCQSVRSLSCVWPHQLQCPKLPCPSPTPGACSYSCPSSQWCHLILLKEVRREEVQSKEISCAGGHS